jgi:L-ascorbate metabolism protein UlaG (beta-lactamase superfamily)
MELTWHGLSCFRMRERGMATVVTDPYSPNLGLPPLKLKADLVTVSNDAPGHNHVKGIKGHRLVIQGPGEFEVGDVFVTGITMVPQEKRKNGAGPNTLYLFDFGGLTVAHLGDLSHVPTQSQIEDLGTVDVALVPVGGGGALAPGEAAEIISLIEPSIVIPMHYKTGAETVKLGSVSRFLSEMGLSKLQPQPDLKVTKSALSDSTQVLLLEMES